MLFTLAGPQQGQPFSIHGTTTWIGRSPQLSVSLDDDAVSAEHAHISRWSDGYHLVDASSRNGTYVNDERVTGSRRLADGDHLRMGNTILKFALVDELEEAALTNLYELAVRDPLTRAFNRRYLVAHLRSELAFAARRRAPLAILLIDIDKFKRVNDSYGHGTGDAVLRLVASSIQRLLRPYDVLCRYGGEEFVVVARETSLRNGEILAERIRRQIADLRFAAGGSTTSVTVSIGITALRPDSRRQDVDALLEMADAALYEAKEAGRNRVRTSQGPRSVSSRPPAPPSPTTIPPTAPEAPSSEVNTRLDADAPCR